MHFEIGFETENDNVCESRRYGTPSEGLIGPSGPLSSMKQRFDMKSS